MDIQEVTNNIEKLEKSRTDIMSFIGAEVAKHPSLKKAFEDLETVNNSLHKCQEEKDKLEKAAAAEAEALAKAQEEAEAAKKAELEKAQHEQEEALAKAQQEHENNAKAEIEKAISEEKELSDEFISDLAKAHELSVEKVEDIIAGVLEARGGAE